MIERAFDAGTKAGTKLSETEQAQMTGTRFSKPNPT